MEFLKGIFIDSLNGFSLSFIPLFLFQLLAAAILGHLSQIFMNKKVGEATVQYGALISCSIALLCSIVKFSLPFSVLAAAILLFLIKNESKSKLEIISLFILALIGVGCGVGSIFQTGLGFILLSFILLFTPIKKGE